MCEEVTIQMSDEIEAVMSRNLDEKSETYTKKIKTCKNCRYYDEIWLSGGRLHCCSYDYDNPITSRDATVIYDECPINHTIEYTKMYIKKYGIIHRKPKGRYSRRGNISVVDFSDTTFESDGYNPDVNWEAVVVFYYSNQEEADVMMELALDYYNRFNLDSEYVEKHCYG